MISHWPTLDDLEHLSDDHELLVSQVTYLLVLLTSLEGKQFERATVHIEAIRQSELLQRELAEHFAFEEATAYRQLAARHPEFGSKLHAMLEQHASILEVFDDFYSALNHDPSGVQMTAVLAKGLEFEAVFVKHATQESQLLRQIASDTFSKSNIA